MSTNESIRATSDISAPEPQPHPVEPVRAVLGQVVELLDGLDDRQYVAASVTTYDGTVGGHVRHCLDHVRALIRGARTGLVDYDDRQRGTDVETDRRTAIHAIGELDRELAALAPAELDQPVRVALILTADGRGAQTQSSLGRELAFLLSHTIHHGAMIGGMVRALGGSVPPDFGYAPSTLAARQHA